MSSDAPTDETTEVQRRLHDLPRQFLIHQIGAVAVASTDLEHEVGHLLAAYLESGVAEIIVRGQGIAVNLQALDAVVGVQPESALRSEVKELISEARRLYERRNAIVHGQWASEPIRLTNYVTMRFRRWGKLDIETVTTDDLIRLTADITDCARRISEHCDQVAGIMFVTVGAELAVPEGEC
jgi:hypothetical protein